MSWLQAGKGPEGDGSGLVIPRSPRQKGAVEGRVAPLGEGDAGDVRKSGWEVAHCERRCASTTTRISDEPGVKEAASRRDPGSTRPAEAGCGPSKGSRGGERRGRARTVAGQRGVREAKGHPDAPASGGVGSVTAAWLKAARHQAKALLCYGGARQKRWQGGSTAKGAAHPPLCGYLTSRSY